MLSVNPGTTGFQVSTPQTRAAAAAASAEDSAAGKKPEGVKVELSNEAMKKAEQAKAEDNSTDPVKMLENQIKELQKQIAEQQKALQAIMSNPSLSPEQRQTQASGVQAELAQLNAALSAASGKLIELLQKSAKGSGTG